MAARFMAKTSLGTGMVRYRSAETSKFRSTEAGAVSFLPLSGSFQFHPVPVI
jgi:hypothetical protein